MVLDIIAAAVLISFGLLTMYFSLSKSEKDTDLIIALLVGIAAFLGGAWIILTRLTLAIILTKLAGLILGVIGLFLIFGFPDSTDYQPEGFTNTGIFVGIVLAVISIWLLFFA
jgi:hypothetical protein